MTVVIMAKAPRMGLAKTRLAKDIGHCHAMRWSRYCLRQAIRAAGCSPIHLHVTPDSMVDSALWPSACCVRPQGNGNLGERLERALDWCPHGPVIIIGCDTPAITHRHVAAARRWLRCGRRAVLGPAFDGGFYLFGVSAGLRRQGVRFAPVRWSSCHAGADIRALLPARTGICSLATLIDIDDGASLAALADSQRAASTCLIASRASLA